MSYCARCFARIAHHEPVKPPWLGEQCISLKYELGFWCSQQTGVRAIFPSESVQDSSANSVVQGIEDAVPSVAAFLLDRTVTTILSTCHVLFFQSSTKP